MTKKAINIWSLGLGATLVLALVAELYRFHGLLLLDLWVPIFSGAYFIKMVLTNTQKKFFRGLPKTWIPAVLFILLGFSSLLINSVDMSNSSFFEAMSYGVRWATYYFLSIVVYKEAADEPLFASYTLKMLIIFGVLLAIFGFAQLILMPDFSEFELLGWDPHQGRLLSTWFDPNFVGGALSFLLVISTGLLFDKKTWRPYLLIAIIIMLIALALTLSRSAYLSFMTGIIVLGILRSRKLIVLGIVATLLISAVSPSVRTRITELAGSVQSVFSENYTLPDPSARLRFGSWKEGWDLFLEKPLLGHGYNAYAPAALKLGTIKDTNIHSASGSDSSLLTVLATTGSLGFLAFFSTYLLLLFQSLQSCKNPRSGGFNAGFSGALAGLFIHSIFVNSLFFPLFMALFWICSGLIFAQKTKVN